jgi:3-oxoacyl-[acyl-carrier protein] reductase
MTFVISKQTKKKIMKTLSEKVILVTGASRGIGAAVALKVANEGAKVIINYAGGREAAEQTVNEIKQQGGDAIALQADVTKPDEVKAMFDAAIAHYGRIDVLVNNAGVMSMSPLKDATDEDFEKQFNTNTKGTFNTLREAATRLADNGSIVNFSTTQTRASFPGYGIYAASKAAVDQFTRIFAKEVGRGINVNSVQPGPIATELFLKGKSEEQIAKLAAANAFNRLGTPADVAHLVAFLVSDDANWISGQNIAPNGGMA